MRSERVKGERKKNESGKNKKSEIAKGGKNEKDSEREKKYWLKSE